jgi:hypothetical protein
MTDEWNKVETEVWNPEEGQEISGIYLGVQPEVGENKSNLYSLEISPGKQISVWGCKVLDGKMIGVGIGQQVKIKFVGRIKPEKGKEYKSFEVYTKPLVK